MGEAWRSREKLRVFISYSRRDLDAADELVAALEAHLFEVRIDRRDLPYGEEWQKEIAEFIRTSDTIIWLISPESVISKWVNWELGEVIRLKKRLVPVCIRQTDSVILPETIGKINILPSDGVFKAELHIETLIYTLNTDRDWLKEGTRLADRAHQWLASRRDSALMLRGSALRDAETWPGRQPAAAPPPPGDVFELILASRRGQTWRQRWAVGASLTIALAGLGLAAAAFSFQRRAEQNAVQADQGRKEAIKTRNEALLSQSKFLAAVSEQEVNSGDPVTGALLALEALPDATSTDDIARTRPYWGRTQISLDRAFRKLRERDVLKGHENLVTSVAVMPDGKQVVTGSWDGTARVWDLASGATKTILKGSFGSVDVVAAMPDGFHIVAASRDNIVRLWDVRTGAVSATLRGRTKEIESIAVSPDGSRIVTGAKDGSVRIWDNQTGAQIALLQDENENEIRCVAVTPDGTRIVASSYFVIRIWDSKTMAEVATLTPGLPGWIISLAVTPDGTRFVTGDNKGLVHILDAKTGVVLRLLGPREGRVFGVAVTPDGRRIITGSGNVDRDGMLTTSSSAQDNVVRIWDAETGAELSALKGHEGSIGSIAVTPDGKHVVTGSEDKTARVWDIRGDFEASLVFRGSPGSGVKTPVITPDGALVIWQSEDSATQIRDAATGVELAVLKGASEIFSAARASDGKSVITGSGDGSANVWDVSTGTEFMMIKGGRGRVTGVGFTPDGTRVIAGSGRFSATGWSTDTSTRENIARIWDVHNGALLNELRGHASDITSVAVTSDGALFVTGSTDNTIRLWDSSTGAEKTALRGHLIDVKALAVSPDGTRIVSGSWDRTARIWDRWTGTQLAVLKHDNTVLSVAVTPDGSKVVTGSSDGTARVWDIQTGTELAVLDGHDGAITSIAVNPRDLKGTHIVAASVGGKIFKWRLFDTVQTLIEEAKKLVPRCLTPRQRQRYYLSPTPPRWCSDLQKWPYDVASALMEGRSLVKEGNDDEARVLLQEAVRRDPSAQGRVNAIWVDTFIERGKNLASDGKDEEANNSFSQALALDPSATKRINIAWSNAFIEFAQKLASEGKNELARMKFGRVLTLAPGAAEEIDAAWVKADLGRVEYTLLEGNDEKTRALLEDALQHHPAAEDIVKIALAYNTMAWRLHLNEEEAKGLVDAEKAVSLAPDNASILDTRGQIYLSLNRIPEACRDLEKSIARGLDAPRTHLALERCRELATKR